MNVGRAPVAPAAWTAVVNPAAGRGRARHRVPAVEAALARSRLDVDVHVSTSADDARAAAGAAVAAGRGVIACGGDGTVRDLAAVAAQEGGVLGIVPTGSGNDFARHLGIVPGAVDAAVSVVEGGRVGLADLGRATTADGTCAWFATVANTGFDGEANRWANTVSWTSGTTLYVLAVLRTLATYRPGRLRVTVDEDVLESPAWLVAVANTRSYAGGMVIAPGAALDDGRLDVCVVGPVSRFTFLRVFPSVFRGAHVRHPMISVRSGTRVTVAALDDDDLPRELWASGERVGALPATLEPVPRALKVMVPDDAPVPTLP
jgi:diacylglycerol kinase (ATP)